MAKTLKLYRRKKSVLVGVGSNTSNAEAELASSSVVNGLTLGFGHKQLDICRLVSDVDPVMRSLVRLRITCSNVTAGGASCNVVSVMFKNL